MLTRQGYINKIGKTAGSNTNKNNRASKLIAREKGIRKKLQGMVTRGVHKWTINARLAYATLILMETGIRVGNESSAEGYVVQMKYHDSFGKEVKTYGLTTLLNGHVRKSGKTLRLSFLGKKAVNNCYEITDKFILKHYMRFPEETSWLNITYNELNKFVKKHIGRQFSPKDFRTAYANKFFVDLIMEDDFQYGLWDNKPIRKSVGNGIVNAKLDCVAGRLSHSRAICKRAYISSNLLEWYLWDIMGWLD